LLAQSARSNSTCILIGHNNRWLIAICWASPCGV